MTLPTRRHHNISTRQCPVPRPPASPPYVLEHAGATWDWTGRTLTTHRKARARCCKNHTQTHNK
ncbi:hypothetical protein CH63R_02913 [Colletotrichum higginsianum IMI 349063]|uniref:Uncharacterized protein n=1 Tax=Colletotrichum higginsianum (strain IMI 349063) TaxID=759273 RepID=A0A1B7YQ68_COLHI|nr:hypothetical protein CH63R_02913 [Colletotrichum higginsianum IMI 349063]OBR14187.1 hypothetical protein CH63R_02913 [Colletotrichum higginsianum IMI 349063]GJC95145.1 hypothetical protein ColKHC_03971 [Colletotrichum higginsianum]